MKSQTQENKKIIQDFWLEDQYYWKQGPTSLQLNKRSSLGTIKSLIWKWFQKVISPTQEQSIKSLKATKKDFWDSSWNIWIRYAKARLNNLKRKEPKVILKRHQNTSKNMKKPNRHYLRQLKNSEDLSTDLKTSSKMLQLRSLCLLNTISSDKTSVEKMSNTRNFYFISEREHKKEDSPQSVRQMTTESTNT